MFEKDIENKVCKYAREKGFLAYKFTSPQRAAVPDRLFIAPDGVMFFIEFKRPGAVPASAQVREHTRLINQGVAVYVIDDVTKGTELVNKYADA